MKQRLEVYEVLKVVCKAVDGVAVYDQGWSDSNVAELASSQLGYYVNPKHVLYVREQMIGELNIRKKREPKTPEYEDLLGRLLDLTSRVVLLESKVSRLLAEKTIQKSFPNMGKEETKS
jgi:hypothetical protein